MAHYCLNEDLMFIAGWTVVFFWATASPAARASLMIQFGSRIVQSNGLETQLVILEEAER